MKSVLLMCNANPSISPRPNRMIQALQDHYKVTVLSYGKRFDESVQFVPLPNTNPTHLIGKLALALRCRLAQFEKNIWHKSLVDLKMNLSRSQFDVIICQNINLLPLALALRNKGKLLFDAREYYPRHFEDKFIWRLFFQKLNLAKQ